MGPSLLERGQEPSQFQQVRNAEGRAAGPHRDEGIGWQNAGPRRWERDESALIVVEVNPVFTPIVPISHQGELAAEERVKRMRNPKSSAGTVQIGCN